LGLTLRAGKRHVECGGLPRLLGAIRMLVVENETGLPHGA
jgi:hypothetical protein